MSLDLKKLEDAINDFVNSDEGKVYFEKEKIKNEIREKRFVRFEEWLKHNDFDKLLYRIINKHNQEYREKFWHNGIEPMPNNILTFILEYVENRCEIVDVHEFSGITYLFKGYYFQTIYGQGVIIKIINKADMRELLVI
jgi:hypothetical protein